MRLHRVHLLLGCAAFVGIVAAAYSCGDYGLPADVKVPGRIQRSVLRGNLLVAVLTDNRLVTVHLRTGATKVLATLKTPTPALDVLDNKVCYASAKRVMIADLTDGKITQAGVCDHDISSLGFLSPERVYTQSGPDVAVLDLNTGKTLMTSSLGQADSKQAGLGYRTLGRSGQQLFVSVASERHAVAVVDLEKGKVVDRISASDLHYGSPFDHPTELYFAGDKVYVLSTRLGYGVWTKGLGIVNLKSRKYTPFKLPNNSMQSPSLVPGANETVFLTSLNGTYQYDTGGKLLALVVAPGDTSRSDATLLGIWRGKALMAVGDRLQQVPLPALTTRAN